MSTPHLVLTSDADELAAAAAARLLGEIQDVQALGRVPSIVLTGGSIADRVHRRVADVADQYDLDWSLLDVWWGDERFVPGHDPQRNALQAQEALLDTLPLDAARVHPMPAEDDGGGLDAAAQAYDDLLTRASGGGEAPGFDVLMLGLGPDGHVASLFPGRPELAERDRLAVGVTGSPKPPPRRITLTYPALNRARQVWFIVSGADKADAVRRAVTGDAVDQTPASGVHGTEETLWLLDTSAAGDLPEF